MGILLEILSREWLVNASWLRSKELEWSWIRSKRICAVKSITSTNIMIVGLGQDLGTSISNNQIFKKIKLNRIIRMLSNRIIGI
jgi:hypothetical protein